MSSVSDDRERDLLNLAFRGLLQMWQCGTPRILSVLSFRAQPADGCDCGWNPRLLFTDCPALAAVLLLPLSTQRRPQVSDRWVSSPLSSTMAQVLSRRLTSGYENRGKYFLFTVSLTGTRLLNE